jgi:putative nucleotidyltransferase with HDIG domain
VDQIKYGMYLAQNIYRHDSLLSLPKGSKIYKLEKETILNNNIDYILVEEREVTHKDDLSFTLGIIEAAYKQTSLWENRFGEELFEGIYKLIIKNKRVQKYLCELRMLDSYSFTHCINVSIVVAIMLSMENKVDKDLIEFTYLALLHDIGRIKMTKLFNKEEKLTEEEFKELQKHPIYSYHLLKKANFDEDILKCVLEHHERYDGAGYPMKLKGEEISDLAQLIQIADIYNGLSSKRPHRDAFMPIEVMQYIEEQTDKAFGKKYINFFFKKFSPYRIGTTVELNDGSTGIVKHIHPFQKLLPTVEIYTEKMAQPILINLSQHRELRIVRIVQSY